VINGDDYGDGSADLSAAVVCPHCGEASEITLDPGGGAHQSYVEDCPVCCRSWSVRVEYAGDGSARVDVSALE
jgi:transposase-like protein